jgi:hypothetical protein
MKKNNIIRKTSFMHVIGLAIFMVAAASANADRIMDEHIIDPLNSTVITQVSTNGEKGEPIIEPVEIEEPLIIALQDDIEIKDEAQNEGIVISPNGETIDIDDENPENSLISTKSEKTDKNTINQGLPPLLGIAIICSLLISFIFIRRKK